MCLLHGPDPIASLCRNGKSKEEEEGRPHVFAQEENDLILESQSLLQDTPIVGAVVLILVLGNAKVRQSTFEDHSLTLLVGRWKVLASALAACEGKGSRARGLGGV